MKKIQPVLFAIGAFCFLIGLACWIALGPAPTKDMPKQVSSEECDRLIGQMEDIGLHPRDIEGSPDEKYLTERALRGD